ncbi:MAG TPA: ATP synthase F1 subunit delta [Anaeromyxobacteraceae bacterium]|nr:ATP synthase F1 subunit delta [Anaeromyxobacteraceae bacterium]
MIVGSIARRYARALFDLALEQGRVEAWAESLSTLRDVVEDSEELTDVLVNPIYVREQRRAIAAKLAAALKLDEAPANLLALLADRNRLSELGGIADAFGRMADEKLGRIRAHVTSAVPLDAATADRLSAKLAQAARAEVLLDHSVDPSLIGGVVAQVGNLVYDGSIRTQLEDLRRTLKQ